MEDYNKMRGSLSNQQATGRYTNKSGTASKVEALPCRFGCGNTTRAQSGIYAPCDILGLAGHRKLRRSFPEK